MRYDYINFIKIKKKLLAAFVLIFLLVPILGHAKTRVSFVSGSVSKANPDQKAILDEIKKGFETGLGDLFVNTINYTSWKDADIRKSILKNKQTDYVLILDSWSQNDAKNAFSLEFQLKAVVNGHFTKDITWQNSTYELEISSGRLKYMHRVIDEVSTNIGSFIASNSDPAKRKFPPRIKIHPSESQAQEIAAADFVKWLNGELNSKYAVGDKKYVFYYSGKKSKIYPENSYYEITCEIENPTSSGGGTKVTMDIYVDKGAELEVDLSPDYQNDEQRKTVIVENFDNTFNEKIQYYER